MGLRKDYEQPAYNIGRLIAIVEINKHIEPGNFTTDCFNNPSRALAYYLDAEILKEEEVKQVCRRIGGLPDELSADERRSAWSGYKHQLAELNKIEKRKYIGKRIMEERIKRKMTQLDLANRTGLSRPNISSIEAGRYSTGYDILQTIAEAMGMTVDLIEKHP